MIVVKKTGEDRFCVDYRFLNMLTNKTTFPIPRIDDALSELRGFVVFHRLDLKIGYWQVPVAKKDRPLTSFTCSKGTFQFKVMPFGLTNAPRRFQYIMSTLFGRMRSQLGVYLDDMLGKARDTEEAIQILVRVFTILVDNGLQSNLKKCAFFMDEAVHLGYRIDAMGVHPMHEKLQGLRDLRRPQTVAEVHSALGIFGQFRHLVRGYADMAQPLHRLTRKYQDEKKDVRFKFSWGRWSREHLRT